ncbi:MAG TPA: hypothetical protein VD735_06035 [Candidatus Saccharimonadales bacterium]|nr:hypothetical protein [Candidatus Saccharimonadales bacterium]
MSAEQAAALVARIRQDMLDAMKQRQRTKAEALKSLLARISNAEAVAPGDRRVMDGVVAGAAPGVGSTDVPRRVLTSADLHAVIYDEVQEIATALAQVDGNTDYAVQLRATIVLIQKYL